ncbi:tetratricopeptide repeat protein [Bacillus sp. JCM 19041]|uniref:response regulator aspartate phosphatase n=1 Tax=Bacillus sp. JCM 19041 TaxID=1460637 RepID=UPI0006CFAB88
MINTVRPELIGAKIVEWHSCIVSKSYEPAVLLKEEVQQQISTMAKNDKIMAYYSLVEFKHNMLVSRYNKNESDYTLELVEEATEIDNMLRYLYYFVSGQSEYVQERYRSAVKMFRKAERLLEYVNDEAEEAEFYLYTGLVNYRLNQYLIASSYMEQAEVIFKRLHYKEQEVNCQIVLAGIYQELHNPSKGEKILLDALKTSEPFPVVYSLILRALGLNKQSLRKFDEAETYFKQALELTEHKETVFGAKTMYNLSNALFNQGKHEEALSFFQMAKVGATYYKNHEYTARCLFVEGLHINNDYNLVDTAIELLEKEGMDFEIAELAEEAARISEEGGNTTLALKYMKAAHNARLYQNTLGDDQFV